MVTILALGAERQAATSLASAYPDCAVIFASDQGILDGADLANVSMVGARRDDVARLAAGVDHVVPLCPRWISRDFALTTTLGRLQQAIPGCVLPVQTTLASSGQWIVKGDRWHRPDAPLAGNCEQLADIADPNECGLVYQPYVEPKSTIMAIGRRYEGGGVLVGIVDVFEERYFHDVILQAGETIDAPDVLEGSLRVLEAVDHHGFFTLNWLRTGEGLKLSSFRPVPRAVFQTFLRGGVDLLAPASSLKVVAPGLRLVADPHYVSFERLSA